MLIATTGTARTRSTPSPVMPVLSGASRRALLSRVWSAAPRIVQVLAVVGGHHTEARAWVGADGSIVVMADWRGRTPTAEALGDAVVRIAVALGVAPVVVQVADAWRWTDDVLEAAWRGGMVLPMPEGAAPVVGAAPAPGGRRRPRRWPVRRRHVDRPEAALKAPATELLE